MKKILYLTIAMLTMAFIFSSLSNAQMARLYGTDDEYKMGVHDGNNFRTSFFNDGTWGGRRERTDHYPGEWPINSGHLYLLDGNPFVISEVNDNYNPITKQFLKTRGTLRRIQATVKSADIQSSTGDKGPDQTTGKWWTFLPLPGFTNPQNNKIAMAKGGRQWFAPADLGSWPSYWPDIADPTEPVYSADGWAGDWNGYFGRNKFNADQESYFVSDDYQKQEFPGFRCDTNDVSRGGIGIRMYTRGFQWSKGLVQDAVFVVMDLKNIGTYLHNKVVFGYKIGNNVGDTRQGSEGGDGGSYNVEHNLAWTWDEDGIGHSTWGTTYGAYTGIFGGCFLESPGNPFDGIDNDNDGKNGAGPIIDLAMFQKRTLTSGEQIVLIDYDTPTFTRIVTTLADTLTKLGKNSTDTLEVKFGSRIFKYTVGDTLSEIGDNLFDDNLNGIIDENRGFTRNLVTNYLYIGHKYIDYKTGLGLTNLLIDERRDDGIDNNGNWNILKDDVGFDGLGPNDRGYPGPDAGEGDGKPSPGERNFDKTDINESDMIGLTSFNLYPWGNDYSQFDDEKMWQIFTPGSFITSPVGNVELSFGSGYFPLPPRVTERFSMGLITAEAGTTGRDTVQLFRSKYNVAKAYELNYNFAKAPDIPKVTAVAGSNRVTLFWDSGAEESIDEMSNSPGGKDFEGYKIYRSTDPNWLDCEPITDGYGRVAFRKPLAQFDLKNDIKGFMPVDYFGVKFFLGDDTGLKHTWVDSTAKNGTTYYYAVTSYDHGDPIALIDPSECTKFVAVQQSGEVLKGDNVVIVRPEAPTAGYIPPQIKDSRFISGPNNTTTGLLDYKVMMPDFIKGNNKYQITFKDAKVQSAIETGDSTLVTQSFTLTNLTSNEVLLLDHPAKPSGIDGFPITEGFQLSLDKNPPELRLDTIKSAWNRVGIMKFDFRNYRLTEPPLPRTKLEPTDYKIIFGPVGIDTSKRYRRGTSWLPKIAVNFKIINQLTNQKVNFAFRERDTRGGPGRFTCDQRGSTPDMIIFLTEDTTVASWQLRLSTTLTAVDSLLPDAGDTLNIFINRPFLSNDTFEFTMLPAGTDKELAKKEMDKIKVVPNPYIVTNPWEPRSTYSSGRGDRILHFTHLPANAVISIFTINGQLVNTLYHNSPINDGTVVWNMLSKDNLDISYGVYIYHVKAEGIGEKIGKFLVLK